MSRNRGLLVSALYDSEDPFGIFDKCIGVANAKHVPKQTAAILLHGGEDISPSIYGQRPNSYMDKRTVGRSSRDNRELEFIDKAVQLGIPVIGICRGAQLLCAYAGGTLVQHVTGHTWGKHDLYNKDGFVTLTNSIHHQMMNPGKAKHTMIAWADPCLSDKYYGEDDEELNIVIEPEIVYFPEIKGFAIQGHPEYLHPENPFVQYCAKEYQNAVE